MEKDLFVLINGYKTSDKILILKAFKLANDLHRYSKPRKSGEPYIIHPIAVATILAEVHADADTIAAGLLHDTIEDCPGVTKELIEKEINPTVAKIVQGVTNINKKQNSEFDRDIIETLDTKRLIVGITQDVRILIVKLADRLHNMRTMTFQTADKQISKSEETLNLYVPLAGYIGEHKYKAEMEDYAFQYSMRKEYIETENRRFKWTNKIGVEINDVKAKIIELLLNENIRFTINAEEKNLFSLYKKILKYSDERKIHDIIQIKIICSNQKECYKARKIIEDKYEFLPDKAKDYIKYPKTNLYRALHTSIIGPDGHSFQCQFITDDMKVVNDYGITAYYYFAKKKFKSGADVMQDEVKNMQFYKVLTKLIETPIRPEEFSSILKQEILSERIYVKTPKGATIELPKGSTPVDFAYRVNSDFGNHIQAAKVNDIFVPLSYELKSDDKIEIVVDMKQPPKLDNKSVVRTFYAQNELEETNSSEERIILRKQ